MFLKAIKTIKVVKGLSKIYMSGDMFQKIINHVYLHVFRRLQKMYWERAHIKDFVCYKLLIGYMYI